MSLGIHLSKVKDPALKHTLQFGIGLHHAGLAPEDRELCEELFAQCKIQVLVATSTHHGASTYRLTGRD